MIFLYKYIYYYIIYCILILSLRLVEDYKELARAASTQAMQKQADTCLHPQADVSGGCLAVPYWDSEIRHGSGLVEQMMESVARSANL